MSNNKATEIGGYKYSLKIDANDFHKNLTKSKAEMQSLDKSFESTLNGLKVGLIAGLATAGIAVEQFCQKAVSQFATFEKSMNEVFTLLPNISQGVMDDMSAQAKEFSEKYGVEISNVTSAMYQAISAGVPQDNLFTFLGQAVQASKGGVTDLTTAVDGLTSVTNAYGDDVLSTATASDQMFTAVKLGKTTFGELATSLSDVVPLASASGITFADVSAAIATMTAQGVSTAQTTTQLKQMFAELTDAGSQVGETFQNVAGQSFIDFIASGKNTNDALGLLADYASTSNLQVNQLFNSIEAGQSALALTGKSATTFSDDINAMNTSSGATETAFKTMENGVTDSLDKISAKLNNKMLDFGQKLEPLVLNGANALSGGLDVLNGLMSNTAVQTAAVTTTAILLYKALQQLGKTDLVSGFINSFKESMVATKASLIMAEEAELGLGTIVKANILALKEQALAFLATPMGTIIAITAAISGIVLAYTNYRNQIEQTAEESRTAYNNTLSDIEQLKSKLDEVKKKISEINENGVDVTEESALKKLQTTNDELERQLRVKQELAQLQGKQAEQDTVNAYNADTLRVNWFSGEYGNGLINFDNSDMVTKFTKELNQIKVYNDQLKELKQNYDNGSISAEEYNSKQEGINKSIVTYEGYLSDSANSLQKTRESLIGATPDGNKLAEEIDGALTSFDDYYKNTSGAITSTDDLTTSIDNATESTTTEGDAVEDTATKISNYTSAIDNMQSAYQNLNSAVLSYNENGYITLDSLQAISNNGYKYLQYLTTENGQLTINTDGYKSLINAQLDELETKQLLQATSELQSLTDEAQAKKYLADVTGDLANSELDAAQATFEMYYAQNMAKGGDVAKATEQIADNFNTFKSLVENTRSQLTSYGDEIEGVSNSTSGASKSTDAYTTSLNAEIDSLNKSKTALESQKEALENEKTNAENAKSYISSLIDIVTDMITKQKNLEKEALENTRDAELESIETTQNAIKDKIKAQQESLDKEKEAFQFQQKVNDYQNSVASNALTEAITSLDDSSAGQKANKSAKDNLADSRSTLSDYLTEHNIDVRNDNLDELSQSVDTYYNNLADSTKASYNRQIDTISEFLSNERQMYNTACSMIDNDNGELYGQLYNYVNTYTTKSNSELQRLWSNAQSAINDYGGANVSVIGLIDVLQGRIYNTEDAITGVASSINTVSGQISNAQSALDTYNDTLTKIVDNKNKLNSGNNGWSYDWGGKTFTTAVQNKEKAAMSLSSQIEKYLGNYVPPQSLYSHMKAYANGTLSATGGLSLVGEQGAELRILNQGDGIIPANLTSNLLQLANNPVGYLNGMSTQTFTNNIAPSINLTIKGNVDTNTVAQIEKVLSKQAPIIANLAAKKIMTIATNNRNRI